MAPCRGDFMERLSAKVDRARKVHDRLNTRPYRVRVVTTRWTGGRRGRGTEVVATELLLSPTPLVAGEETLEATLGGAVEAGGVVVSEVSWRYDKAQLKPDVGADGQSYIEVEDGYTGERTRMTIVSDPERDPDAVGWTFRCRVQRGARTENGRPLT